MPPAVERERGHEVEDEQEDVDHRQPAEQRERRASRRRRCRTRDVDDVAAAGDASAGAPRHSATMISRHRRAGGGDAELLAGRVGCRARASPRRRRTTGRCPRSRCRCAAPTSAWPSSCRTSETKNSSAAATATTNAGRARAPSSASAEVARQQVDHAGTGRGTSSGSRRCGSRRPGRAGWSLTPNTAYMVAAPRQEAERVPAATRSGASSCHEVPGRPRGRRARRAGSRAGARCAPAIGANGSSSPHSRSVGHAHRRELALVRRDLLEVPRAVHRRASRRGRSRRAEALVVLVAAPPR